MKNIEEKLFELVSDLGETLEGDLHIIEMSDWHHDFEDEQKFRVYHKQGFCFDIERTANYDTETEEFLNWEYYFYSEWDGFDPCTPEKSIEVIEYFKMIRSTDYG